MTDKSSQIVKDGYALFEVVVSSSIVTEALDEFQAKYAKSDFGYHAQAKSNSELSAIPVGNKRHALTLRLEGAFANPALFANPSLLPTIFATLGSDCIIDGFGVVVSLPGAARQQLHRDGGFLFPSNLGAVLPPHSLTMVIPLVDMNDASGTTHLWPGTHRNTMEFEEFDGYTKVNPPVAEELPAGSAAIWDFRLIHSGAPNNSPVPRPILYITYSKPWFTDRTNWRGRFSIFASKNFLNRLTGDARHLFRFAQAS